MYTLHSNLCSSEYWLVEAVPIFARRICQPEAQAVWLFC